MSPEEERRWEIFLRRQGDEATVRKYVRTLAEVGVMFTDGEYHLMPLPEGDTAAFAVVGCRGVMVYSGPKACCEWFADEANLLWAEHLMVKGTCADPSHYQRDRR